VGRSCGRWAVAARERCARTAGTRRNGAGDRCVRAVAAGLTGRAQGVGTQLLVLGGPGPLLALPTRRNGGRAKVCLSLDLRDWLPGSGGAVDKAAAPDSFGIVVGAHRAQVCRDSHRVAEMAMTHTRCSLLVARCSLLVARCSR
ncbi:MAG: hypothetical protein ACK58T_31470, partial [Phycisphaerae bacterium]